MILIGQPSTPKVEGDPRGKDETVGVEDEIQKARETSNFSNINPRGKPVDTKDLSGSSV